MENLLSSIQNGIGPSIVKFGTAIIMLIIGLIIIRWVVALIARLLEPSKLDKTLKPFIISLVNISLKVVLLIAIIDKIGVETTSFIAILGAASFAVGLAFQGALSNFAGGVLILSLRPFHVGDVIEVDGFIGSVEAIHVFNTIIVTPMNKVIIIPNGQLSNATISNYSTKPTRRIDLTFGVGYDSDLKLVKSILEDIANAHPLVLDNPAPFVRLAEHGDSSLNFTVKVWAKSNMDDYWAINFDMISQVKEAFDKNNISIPFPQMDVHIDK